MGLMLQTQFKTKGIWVKVNKNVKLDCMFFRAGHMDGSNDWQERSTFILCNSNAMYYQQMVHASHCFYLKFFLEKGINVFVWNYRGYGRSSGTPCPDNLKSDIQVIYDYLRNQLQLKGKIGVYGRSLGGIPSSHLSSKVQMAIVDRSFSSFDAMAKYRFFSKAASYFFWVGSLGWQVQSDESFLKPSSDPGSPTTYKVVMQDKLDQVVCLHACLMLGVANHIKNQQLKRLKLKECPCLPDKLAKELIQNLNYIQNIENALFCAV